MNTALKFITNFGDLGVLLPLAAAILVWLLSTQSREAALWWTTSFIVCAALTTLLKVCIYSRLAIPNLVNPSGHTSLSTLIYGVLVLFPTMTYRNWWFRAGLAIGLISFILVIATSRVELRAHSWMDTVFGIVIGAAALAMFAWGYRRHKPAQRPLFFVMATSIALIAVFHGRNLNIDHFLRSAVPSLMAQDQPFTERAYALLLRQKVL